MPYKEFEPRDTLEKARSKLWGDEREAIPTTRLEEMILKIADAQPSGNVLPAVTADDNGDVLTVVEGAWAKATPSGGDDQYPSYDIVFAFDANEWTMIAKKGTRADVMSIAQRGGFVRTMVEETVVPTGETKTVYISGLQCEIRVDGNDIGIFHCGKDTSMQDTTCLWAWNENGEIVDDS